MKLADVNIWLALALSTHQHHSAAGRILLDAAKHDPIAFCRSTQQSFLRLLTTRALMETYGGSTLSNREAWNLFERFMEDERVAFLSEPSNLTPHWKRLAAGQLSSPKLWMDAYLAAFALTANCPLVTTDKAFAQFRGIKIHLVSND